MTKHILLPVDPDEETSWAKALPEAVDLARHRAATLHVMTVVPNFGSSIVASYFPEGFEQKALNQAEAELAALIRDKVPADLPHQLIVAHGRIYQEICRAADKVGADLIVMASHRPTLADNVLAPTARQVLNHTPISVLVVR